jgi:chromosome segregation ATPase
MSELFDGFWDWLSGGQVTRNEAERRRLNELQGEIDRLRKKYHKWHDRGRILSRSLYRITLMAFKEVCKMQDIISHLTVKQRRIVEYSLKNEKYELKEIEKSIAALNSSLPSLNIDSEQFMHDTVKGNMEILEALPNQGGLAATGIYTAISALEYYTALENQNTALKAGQYEALNVIDEIKKKLFELKVEVYRIDEMGTGIGKGITAFRYCFDAFSAKLFPLGEESKRQRESRLASGGTYFLDSEEPEVQALLISAGFVLEMIEAKP